jgi:DNA-binding CsgD family transcriptional regulator/tetratricopeptide (TPR) repeat protein
MGNTKSARMRDLRAGRRAPTRQGPEDASSTLPVDVHDIAPHVRAAIDRACGGDAVASAAVRAALTPEARRGWRAPPDPLPAIPAAGGPERRALPRDADPEQVLALALCEAGPVQVLCAIAGCGPDRIPGSPLTGLVRLHGGRFRFADAALRVQVLAAASTQERLRAHRLLAELLQGAGRGEAALWHRARGAVAGDPALVEPLLALARIALREGDAERAWSRATEAAEHAPSGTATHAGALLLSGRAALAAGWIADAAERFEQVLRIDRGHRAEAAQALVLTHALRHGTAPAPDPRVSVEAIGRGTAFAVRLSAPFGAALGGRRPERRRLEAGAAGVRGAIDEGGAVGRVTDALRAGIDGDPDAGIRALADADPDPTADAAPPLGLHARAPLLGARRAVAGALLHVWAGRIGIAHRILSAAAADLPVALPFGGVAAPLCRRLELAIDGRIGPLSHELTAAVPCMQDSDGFVDRAIAAYLRGRTDEAAVHMALWSDRGRPPERFGLPGLDEIGPLGASAAVETPEAALARTLRERIRSARESSSRTVLEAVAAESRGIRSAFERGRVEALLGSAAASRGDRGRGVRHLRAALSLFEESGALAWRGMVCRRLRALGEHRRASVAGVGAPEEQAATSSLDVCRAMWEPILTARELDVALLMAEGRTNKEIALALHVSVRTVEVHGGRIFAKVDVRTRHELTVLAHRTDQHL